MRKMLIWALPLLLLGAGCVPEITNNVEESTEATIEGEAEVTLGGGSEEGEEGKEAGEDEEEGAIVTITDGGFSPATLTVKAGTTVTFMNKDSAPHWPASNPHPVHTALLGFDAKISLATDQTYNFTFNRPGTWRYHDHLNPGLVGQVVVE